MMKRGSKRTKIVATIGPASRAPATLRALVDAGLNVARLNFSHGTHAEHASVITDIRRVATQTGVPVAVLQDLPGPKVRTGSLAAGVDAVRLTEGATFALVTRDIDGTKDAVSASYPGLARDVESGKRIYLADGAIALRITATSDDRVDTIVEVGGDLRAHQGINYPDGSLDISAVTDRDFEHLAFGLEAGVDWVAISFVKSAEDVLRVKRYIAERGKNVPVIAKIEKHEALEAIDDIIAAADGIMVARGDLGIEIDYHILPLVQMRMVEVCLAEGKPVIIATQLLESMISSPMPTRAEISDVSNAVRERADAVMLSGETTTGMYPLECVDVMKNILRSIEPSERRGINEVIKLEEPKAKMLRSAAILAQELGHSGIIVFTRSGFLAYTLAALRATGVPIFAFTDDEALFRQLLLPWGVEPFLMPFNADPEITIRDALEFLKRRDWVEIGQWMVVITNALAHEKVIDTLQLRKIE
jgi:pyruvate kinase